MRSKTATEALDFLGSMFAHAFKKGALCDTEDGPIDVHEAVECITYLRQVAAWSDRENAARVAQMNAAKMEQAASPCGECDDKAKAKTKKG